ncbi:hypothetical protein D3C86_1930060 [compost metagenome]
MLEVEDLRNGLLDQIYVADRVLDGGRRRDALGDLVGRIHGEDPPLAVVGGLADEAFTVGDGELGTGIGQDDLSARQRQDLGDAAAHVAGADDGHLRDHRDSSS